MKGRRETMALLKLEDIKKLLDENKINLKDLEKVSELEKIKEKNGKIVGLLDKFEKLVNNKKVSTTEVDKMLNDIIKILNDKLPKRKVKKSASTPEKEEKKVKNVENEVEEKIENENNENL